MVVAIGENNAIGKDNELLWYLPKDLRHFKTITNGHTVIMGRKTFESVGKPLRNRRNIIITRNTDLQIEGTEVVHTIEDALELAKEDGEVFIIGGAEIYKMAMKHTDKIFLTVVHETFEADAFFPEIDKNLWVETASEKHLPDEKNNLSFTFSTLERK
ncbi:MAG: dihydrofolate reductase [Pedobacter sp.]